MVDENQMFLISHPEYAFRTAFRDCDIRLGFQRMAANFVYRHHQTLSSPKRRLEVIAEAHQALQNFCDGKVNHEFPTAPGFQLKTHSDAVTEVRKLMKFFEADTNLLEMADTFIAGANLYDAMDICEMSYAEVKQLAQAAPAAKKKTRRV